MKLSNLFLSIVATFMLGLAVGSTDFVMSKQSTAAINVPIDDTVKGNGLVIQLPANLTPKQKHVLSVAYETAQADGHKYPQLLQAILLQETKAGGMNSYKVAGNEFGLKPNLRYYGVAQLKLSATRDVLAKWPELWDSFEFQGKTDEEVIAKLIENERFNIAIASKYLLILKSRGYTSPGAIAAAYNKGPTGARGINTAEDKYSKAVDQHIRKLQTKS